MNNLKLKGYGFNPSEQILIGYLRDRTTSGRDYLVQDIIDLSHDICSYDPWDLPGCDSITPHDSERFFIYPKTYKYANSKSKVIGTPTEQVPNSDQRQPMINRATKNGKWKVSGVRVNVKSSDETKQVIGIKTRLYFKHNNCSNKTSCVLHQFELVDFDPCQDKYFLGKVIMKEFKPTNISSNNINDRISIPEDRVELGPEPLLETEVTNEYESTQSEQTNEFITPYPVFDNENFIDVGNEVISNHQSQPLVEIEATNEYGWTQSQQTNEFITPYPVFDKENFIDDGNEVISNHQSQIRVELGSEPLVEIEATNEYSWTQSQQTNEFITPYPVFDNENFIYDGNEVISNHQSQIRVELGLEPLVEITVTNEYGWTQSEQTNEFIAPCPVFDNENFIDDGNEVISNHQSQIRVELGSEPLVEIEATNKYGWTQSQQTNEFITPYPVFDNENFIYDENEVISNHQSQIRVELGLEPLVEITVTNEYGWTQSEQTNEFIAPCPVFDNENFIDDGNEVISNHQSQINMEQIRSLEVPNIGIEDLNQSYQNIGIDINDPTVPDEGSNQQNIVAVAENESSILPSNLHNLLIDFILYFINQIEWSDLYNLCRFINQQLAAGAEIEFPNLPPLDVAESSYSTDSVRKRSAMEVERLATGVETELAQQQAKRSRL